MIDMINDGADTDNEFLLELLRNIHDDWIREHGNDHDDPGTGTFHHNIIQHVTC